MKISLATPKNGVIFYVMRDEIGYLILNTGAPDKPSISALKRYLKQFLFDLNILDYPPFLRLMVENLIPSLNDNEECFEGFANFFDELEADNAI